MDKILLEKLKTAFNNSWSAETSSSADWTSENPSKGQCSVTSCVAQDYLGGEIMNCIATFPDGSTGSHFVNYIDGQIIDFTRQQFPDGTIFSEPQPKTKGFPTTRDFCISAPDTRHRYEILKQKVSEQFLIQ